ncbi:MAG: hypothetical protein RL097_658 [Candidatus Parcubacteria bacterium]
MHFNQEALPPVTVLLRQIEVVARRQLVVQSGVFDVELEMAPFLIRGVDLETSICRHTSEDTVGDTPTVTEGQEAVGGRSENYDFHKVSKLLRGLFTK